MFLYGMTCLKRPTSGAACLEYSSPLKLVVSKLKRGSQMLNELDPEVNSHGMAVQVLL